MVSSHPALSLDLLVPSARQPGPMMLRLTSCCAPGAADGAAACLVKPGTPGERQRVSLAPCPPGAASSLAREHERPEEPAGAAPRLPPALPQVRWSKLPQPETSGGAGGAWKGSCEGVGFSSLVSDPDRGGMDPRSAPGGGGCGGGQAPDPHELSTT